ncbi:unnamed protein product, partial [Nesidiocoris tenuis]
MGHGSATAFGANQAHLSNDRPKRVVLPFANLQVQFIFDETNRGKHFGGEIGMKREMAMAGEMAAEGETAMEEEEMAIESKMAMEGEMRMEGGTLPPALSAARPSSDVYSVSLTSKKNA